MQRIIESFMSSGILDPEPVKKPSDTNPNRFSYLRFALFGLLVIAVEAIAELLDVQSYKMSGTSLVWLPNGLVIGALLCSPKKRWPAYLILGHTIDFAFNMGYGGTVGSSFVYAAFNSLEIITAALLLYRHLGDGADLTQYRQLRAFLQYGVFVAPLTAAVSASLYLHFHDGVSFGETVRFWYAADMIGLATITPLYLSYQHGKRISSRSIRETTVLFILLTVVVISVFGFCTYPSLWIVLLALILLGVRAGFTASAAGLLIVIAGGGYLTVLGRGPLGTSLHHSMANNTIFFQTFVGVTMVGLYMTEVAMSANRRAKGQLVDSEARYRLLADDLEKRVQERTLALQKEIAEREAIQRHLISAKMLAEESNRAKSVFLANMSHELRTPLNAILGYSELLQEEAEDRSDNSAVSDLGRIQKAGRHLLTIINDILDLSKIESGRIELKRELITVARVVEDVTTSVAPLARVQNNQFRTFMSDPSAEVNVDIVKFRQCLLNLISNACKFTENGSIDFEVLVEPSTGETRWVVKDSGIGIREKDLSRLFHSFSQVDSSSTRRHDGTGLGLVISRRLVNLMGGEITVQSTFGEGSTFTIVLPATKVAPAELASVNA